MGGGCRRVVGWFCLVFEDGVEWWLGAGGGGELSGVVVGGDVDLVEEGLVEQAADVVGCSSVGVGGVLGQVEGLGDELLLGVQVLVQGGLPALDGGQFAGDAGLLGFEGFQGDGVGVVGLEEFFALALQSAAVGRQVVQLLGGLLGQLRQLGVQGLLQLSGVLGVLRTVVFGGLRLLVSGCSARVRPRWGCGTPVPSGVAYDYRSVRSTRQHL